jgi:glycine/D-amino acid oxidase-like deaminating enzyme
LASPDPEVIPVADESGAASSLPATARVVVIGAGIVGNSLACHLARLGWTGIVQLDKGPLPNPGGSTGHASNFIFPVDHSREMTALTLDSMRQYKALGVFTVCGGIEVARTEERMEELRRRVASAKAWGVEPVALLTPEEVKALVPYIDESVILGGFHSPGVGVVDSLQAGTLMREEAQRAGALKVVANVEVTGIDVERGRVRRVRTTAGDVDVLLKCSAARARTWARSCGHTCCSSLASSPTSRTPSTCTSSARRSTSTSGARAHAAGSSHCSSTKTRPRRRCASASGRSRTSRGSR